MRALKSFRAVFLAVAMAMGVQSDARGARAAGPDHVDITWFSISNMYYEIGPLGVVTDGYISRVPQRDFFGGGGGLAETHTPFASDAPAVKRVLDALGGPSRVGLLLTGHSHFDHSLDTPTWSKLTGARIIGSPTTCFQAQAEDVPASRCTAVMGRETMPIADGVTMRVVRWNHSGDPAVNPEQHNPVELKGVPARDRATGGLRPGVAEDFPNGGGNRAFLFTVDGPAGRFSWFFQNSASAVDLQTPIVLDGVNYGAPLDNLRSAMKDAGLTGVDLWIGTGGKSIADLVLPVLHPKAYLPVHWDGLWNPFEGGVRQPFADPSLESALAAAGVTLVRPRQYMDKWRLDRSGVRELPNDDVKRALGFAPAAIAPAGSASAAAAGPSRCDDLARVVAAPTPMTVTGARVVAGGAFQPPGTVSAANARTFASLPAFCRVSMTLTPTPDSDISVEVWLPASGWNGKYEAVGNGGWAGSLSYPAMADALAHGYATASTDTGHTGSGAAFALGHPEKLVDYAYRSEHLMTLVAKAVATSFYGRSPARSYWSGCSNGGKQGLIEAQRFPGDYDGIVAGAPAANWIGRAVQSMRIAQANLATPDSRLPAEAFSLIHGAVLDACDAADGVKDGVLENPTACAFDPGLLTCKGSETAHCLTRAQTQVVRTIYAPVRQARTGAVIFPGHEPGSELGWSTMAGSRPFAIGLDHFRYVVFANPDWDYRSFNLDQDASKAFASENLLNARDPDLRAFLAHGKLIQYHGWSDPQISPRSSIEYYQSVAARLGEGVGESYRMFMVPGMAHCGGGEGPNTFDMMSALEDWVEHGRAPDRVVAARVVDGRTVRTRPLCPYPQTAVYRGSGSTDDQANFTCARS